MLGNSERLCANHSVPVVDDGDGMYCPRGHRVTLYRVLDRKKNTMSEVFSVHEIPVRMTQADARKVESEVTKPNARGTAAPAPARASRAAAILERGIQTDRDFSMVMAAVMRDLADGTMPPKVASAIVAAGDQILKVVEMRLRIGELLKEKSGAMQLLPADDSSLTGREG